jgi:amino acid transporter
MEPSRHNYGNDMEMNQYHGMEVNSYNGMEVNSYQGNVSDEASEKRAFQATANVYEEDPRSRLHRDLKTRQISMIALGGALGTGLLINT